MSHKASVVQRIDGWIAECLRRLYAAALLVTPFPAKRDGLLQPVRLRIDATCNRPQRTGAAHWR
jgi:hypothetical protein